MTRGALRKTDRSLYQVMWRKGLLENVPLQGKRVVDDPLQYYQKHYKGMTRGDLAKKDHGLYKQLLRADKIRFVPTKGRHLPDPLAFYSRLYGGMTRGQLERADYALYRLLTRRNLLWKIPCQRPKVSHSSQEEHPVENGIREWQWNLGM